MELNNQIASGIVSASDIVRVMLVSVNSDQINREKVPYSLEVESATSSWLINVPVLRPASSLLVKGS